jgi:hypothetical protein
VDADHDPITMILPVTSIMMMMIFHQGGDRPGLVRALSVPTMESLDTHTDHIAVSVLMGPDGTPRVLDAMSIHLEMDMVSIAEGSIGLDSPGEHHHQHPDGHDHLVHDHHL